MDASQDTDEAALTAEELARSASVYRWLDIVVAAFFLVLGVVVLAQVATELPLMRFGQVGPGMLPSAVGSILIGLGGIAILQNLTSRVAFSGTAMPTLKEGVRVAAVVVLLILTILFIPVLGTLASLMLFILIELRFVERRSWTISVATAALVPLFIHTTFEAMLGVALPAGILGLR